jgi:transcriptional antiterminator RfaH
MSTRWYVCHTRAYAEAKAAAHLQQQNFEVYVPRIRKQCNARRTENVSSPLFPSYLFVMIDINTQRWRSICSTQGVSRLVCSGDTPTPVPPGIVEELKKHEDADGFIRTPLRVGDKVRVGAFDGLFDGKENERVAVLLNLLGQKIRVVLDADLAAAA